jgi:hypothetical protein
VTPNMGSDGLSFTQDLGPHFAVIPTVAEPRNKARRLGGDRDRAASPPNLIREMSRFDDSSDPPNLQRLSTRQAIEERGIAEIQDRFVDAGVVARIHDDHRRLRRP